MIAEFFLDLCFIREHEPEQHFEQAVEQQLQSLFTGKGSWHMEAKQQDQELVDIVVAEVKGMAKWQCEEEILAYLEENAALRFMDWLQGYRIQLDIKEAHEGCSHCGKN
ncbi:hypothetical protein FHS16_003582 [Paenibacillus endophyticus]|uniref:Uncharacterized protein n=1 Tax=Paenibacillus endophyticus TaxID=1294268 RepID=A0A7W5GB80_9BACL|nr:hypothetical protein [Paenibacillus endophyticus]MBB3153520.1 hypothetical protein [Paenibacillus endophyticus]